MKKAIAKFIVDQIDCEDDARIYEDYSGRGMYGETTCGVVCNDPMVIADTMIEAYLNADPDDIEQLNEKIDEEDVDNQSGLRFDSLGMQYIVY